VLGGGREVLARGRADRCGDGPDVGGERRDEARGSSPVARKKAAAAAGRGGRRPGRAAAAAARRGATYGSDTMLGIDKLYSLGAKGHNI
jgi:hypothetical protein